MYTTPASPGDAAGVPLSARGSYPKRTHAPQINASALDASWANLTEQS
jgi:hypothetical protein